MNQRKNQRLLLFILVLALVGCNSSKEITVQLKEEPVYASGETSTVVIEVLEEEQPMNDVQLSGLLEMERMDHGQMDVVFQEISEGIYETEVEFPMGGEWIIQVTADDQDWTTQLSFEVGEENELE